MTASPAYTRKLFGIHTGASVTTAFDAIITKSLIDEYVGEEPKPVVVPQVLINDQEDVMPLRDQTIPYGLLVHPHSSGGKNSIVPSPLAPHLRMDPVYPMKSVTIPTVMYTTDPHLVAQRWVREGMLDEVPELPDKVDPMKHAYSVAPPFKHIDDELLEMAWRSDSIPRFPNGYRVLSPEEAVFGVPELGIAPIDFTTSAGYNWANIPSFTRYTLFNVKKNDVQPTRFAEWHPEMRKAILEVLKIIANRDLPLGLVVDALKAERRKFKRVLAGQTRLFYAGSIVHLVVSRMFTAVLSVTEKSAPTVSVPAKRLAR
jgi:hypothetical protein